MMWMKYGPFLLLISRLYAGEHDLPMEWLLLKLYSTHTNFLKFEFESIRGANCPVKSLMQRLYSNGFTDPYFIPFLLLTM